MVAVAVFRPPHFTTKPSFQFFKDAIYTIFMLGFSYTSGYGYAILKVRSFFTLLLPLLLLKFALLPLLLLLLVQVGAVLHVERLVVLDDGTQTLILLLVDLDVTEEVLEF